MYIPFDPLKPIAGDLYKENQKQTKEGKSSTYTNMLQ